ncbi:MAG TPA: DinB family protein [Saprospiraceae bacterium]|nr:DinB family protein [Saprospiraceae bacterium]
MNIEAIAAAYELQTSWFVHALENISEEESITSFAENFNPIKWIAGHLTDARMTVVSLLTDTPVHSTYKKQFGKGSSNQMDASFPTLEQIKTDWRSISEELKIGLTDLTNEKLQAKPPFQTSIPDETFLGLITYFVIHESFHIGQLSILRKLIQKPTMAMGRLIAV